MKEMLFAPQVREANISELEGVAKNSALVLLGSVLAFIFLRSPETCGIGYVSLIPGIIAFGSLIRSLEIIQELK